jgi:spermidine synthase
LANLLLAYAIVEVIIAVLGIVFHRVFIGVFDFTFASLLPLTDSVIISEGIRWTVAATLIFPQSVLLGMTFPLISSGLIRFCPDRPGESIAWLYFANSFGAAFGVLVSTFALIPAMGLPGTVLTAGMLNALVAALAWGLARSRPTPPLSEIYTQATANRGPIRLFLSAAFITGAASFIYEIAWIRMLSLVLGATTHAFELMLSAFILGIAFGGLWIRRRIDHIHSPASYAGWVQIIMGLLALLTLPVYYASFDLMSFLLGGLAPTTQGYVIFNVSSHLIALMVMLPATFCAGMTLPLFTAYLLRSGYGERSIGNVYATNTLGAIAGVLFATHFGLPWLSVKGAIQLGALLDVALGLVLLHSAGSTLSSWRLRTALASSAIVFLSVALLIQFDPLVLGSGVYRHGQTQGNPGTEVRFYRDGKTASIMVAAENDKYYISTNGKPDAAIMMTGTIPAPDETTQVLIGTLPLAHKPDARRAAVIGLGSGQTTHALLHAPGLEQVDTIEIEAAMVEGARRFLPRVERTFTDPRSRLVIDDAKAFFARQHQPYDIIISEPSNPWVSGVSSLFTREFYPRIANSLTDDGLLVQWIQLYEIDMNLVSSIIKALDLHFQDYVLYTPNFGDAIIIAKKQGKLTPANSDILFNTEMAELLTRIGIHRPADVEIRRLASRDILIPLFERYPAPPNSDYFPFLDQKSPQSRFMRTAAGVGGIATAPLPAIAMLEDREESGLEGSVTPSDSLPRSQMAAAAIRFLAEMTGIVSADADKPYPMQDVAAALRAQLNMQGCTIHYRSLLDEFYEMSTTVHSVLSQEEVSRLWDALEEFPCIEGLPPRLQTWVRLFKATTSQSPADMVTNASALLATKDSRESRNHYEYQVAALVTGHLALNEPFAAMKAIQKHSPNLLRNSKGAAYLQLLTGLTIQRVLAKPVRIADSSAQGYPEAR